MKLRFVMMILMWSMADIAAAKTLNVYYDAYGSPHGGSVGVDIKLTRKFAVGPYMSMAQSETSVKTTYRDDSNHKEISVAGAGIRGTYQLSGLNAYSTGWYLSGFASQYSIDDAEDFAGHLHTENGLNFVNCGSTLGYQIKAAGFLIGRLGAGLVRTYVTRKDGQGGKVAATLPAFDLSLGIAL